MNNNETPSLAGVERHVLAARSILDADWLPDIEDLANASRQLHLALRELRALQREALPAPPPTTARMSIQQDHLRLVA